MREITGSKIFNLTALLSVVIVIVCFMTAVNIEVGGAGGDGYFLRIVAILIGIAALFFLFSLLVEREVDNLFDSEGNIYGSLIKEVQRDSESSIKAKHILRLANSCGTEDTPEARNLEKLLDGFKEGRESPDGLHKAIEELRRVNLRKVMPDIEKGGWRREKEQ